MSSLWLLVYSFVCRPQVIFVIDKNGELLRPRQRFHYMDVNSDTKNVGRLCPATKHNSTRNSRSPPKAPPRPGMCLRTFYRATRRYPQRGQPCASLCARRVWLWYAHSTRPSLRATISAFAAAVRRAPRRPHARRKRRQT